MLAPTRNLIILGGGGVYTPEATALFARFTTPPSKARKILINNRIIAAKASGAWAVRDGFYMMAAADAQAAQRNWKQDAYNLTPSGATPPAFAADRGYTGNGTTGYLATGFVPSTAGGNYSLNSSHLSVWSLTNAQSSGISIGARTTGSTGQSLLIARSATDTITGRLNQDASGATIANTDSSGAFVVRRANSANLNIFRNGASLGTVTVASTGLTATEITIGALNNGGTIASFNNYQFGSAGFGGNLTDAQILAEYQADLVYLQAVGAV